MSEKKWFRSWGFHTVYPIRLEGVLYLIAWVTLMFLNVNFIKDSQDSPLTVLGGTILLFILVFGGGWIMDNRTEDRLRENENQLLKEYKDMEAKTRPNAK